MISASTSTPSLSYRLSLALLVLVAVAKPILMDTLDPDCFWHLRVAQSLLHQGIGPLVDDLSFNSIREPWTPYSWLAQLAMLGVWNLAGWQGAVAVHAAMSAAFVLLVAAGCRELQRIKHREGELNTVLATAAACVWSLAYLSFRPATLAIDLLALAAWLILRDRRLGERSLAIWLLVPLTAVLTNVHLTAMLVPIWLAALAAGSLWERLRVGHAVACREVDERHAIACPTSLSDGTSVVSESRTLILPSPRVPGEEKKSVARYALLAILTSLAYLATPMLPGMLRMLHKLQSEDVMVSSPILAEMRPFYDGAFGKVSLVLVLMTLAACVANRKRIRAGEWLWLGVMVVFLLRLGRFSPLFAIVAAPMAAAYWPRLSDRPLRRGVVLASLALLLLIGGVRIAMNFPTRATPLSSWLNRHVPVANGYPTDAATFVDAHVTPHSGHMINELNWGGYLAWRLGDRYQTFIDGRTQMHSPAFFRDVFYGDLPTRTGLVKDVDADFAILPTKGSVFHDPLTTLGWRSVWRDDQSEVMLPPTTVTLQAD